MANNWFYNPAVTILRTHLSKILNEKYYRYDNLIERIGSNLIESDANIFGALIADIYEMGYIKAVKDYEKELKKLGYEVNIVIESEAKPSAQIFK